MNDLMRWDSYSLSSFAYYNDRALTIALLTVLLTALTIDFLCLLTIREGQPRRRAGLSLEISTVERSRKKNMCCRYPFRSRWTLSRTQTLIVKLPIISILWSVYFHSIDNIIGESLPVTRSHTDWNHKTALFGWVAEVLPIDKFNSVATFGLLGFILITYLCTL